MKTWLAVVSFLCGFACLMGHNVAFARGGGGCFEQGTPVLTPQGNVAIEQLRVGDMVSGGGKVVATYQVQPTEYLEIPGGIHVTPEHPFQTAPGIFQTAERVFPNAPRVLAAKPAYNIMVSPGGVYSVGTYLVHNKGCFLPDTPILRADRTSTAISQVRVGDRLLAFDSDSKVVETTVRSVITREADEYLTVRTNQAELRVTREHPFYIGEGTFKTLEALHVGDKVFAFDGNGLTAQTISAIEPVPGTITVYNLQTDAPNTYFAAGIAVHNKGGGGGGHSSGSSFHHSSSRSSSGNHYYNNSHSGSDNDDVCGIICLILIILVIVILIVVAIQKNKQQQTENLDFCYGRRTIDIKVAKTQKVLDFLVRRGDDSCAPDRLKQQAKEVFVKLQYCWQARSYNEMQKLLIPDLYADHCKQLNGLRRNHEINCIEGLDVQQVDIVHVRCPAAENQREFTALITASAVDYYIDDQTRNFLRGDKWKARFQEFWIFQRQDGQWLLREIEQTRESDKLKEENFVEQLNAQELRQLYAGTGKAEDKAGVQEEELKASRIERLLDSLAKTDGLWDMTAMRARARQVLIAVVSARESGFSELVPEDMMVPAAAAALRQHLAQMQESGLSIEYRNLCVRKVQIAHVHNCADNSKDEFTARISVHAQIITRRGNDIARKDEHVLPFVEYWTFGRHENRWKLKEVLPEASGKQLEAAENVDEDNVLRQVQWQYRQSAATCRSVIER